MSKQTAMPPVMKKGRVMLGAAMPTEPKAGKAPATGSKGRGGRGGQRGGKRGGRAY